MSFTIEQYTALKEAIATGATTITLSLIHI